MPSFTDAELVAFLDEALPANRSSQIEHELRTDASLRTRLIEVRGRETAGLHSIGGIWRRSRLSCPTRSEMGQYLLAALSDDHADYVRFHIETIGCRYCQANLADLESAAASSNESKPRRTKYFQTSAGYLKRE